MPFRPEVDVLVWAVADERKIGVANKINKSKRNQMDMQVINSGKCEKIDRVQIQDAVLGCRVASLGKKTSYTYLSWSNRTGIPEYKN